MLCGTNPIPPTLLGPLPEGDDPAGRAGLLPGAPGLPLTPGSDWATAEFAGAQLGDLRQVHSLQQIAAALAEYPHRSLTAACGPRLRQAAHRLFEHPETTPDGLLAGHYQQTAARCQALPLVLVAQDTCYFVYQQQQIVGLAAINQSQKSRALIVHGALALTPQGTPLGLVALESWGEDPMAPARPKGAPVPPEERESQKWTDAFSAGATRLADVPQLLVVADREADVGRYLTQPRRAGLHHLVRVSANRNVTAPTAEGEPETLGIFAAVDQAPVLGTHQLAVPRKLAQNQQIMLPARQVTVEVQVQTIHLRPSGKGAVPTEAWVIQTRELDPPAGEAPAHWVLITTLPVPDLATACQIVGYYAKRWLIERLHFTLKSGLRAERLQIDDAVSLGHALAVYYVVAWRLLHLTYLGREFPEHPARDTLEADEVAVLAGATGRTIETVGEAILAVAELGGWQRYPKAPPPGVKSLWVGWITLRGMVQGYRLALRRSPPDL